MSTEKSVVRRLIENLAANGFTITRINDGGDEDVHVTSIAGAIDTIFSVEESTVFFSKSPDGRQYSAYIVLGNDPKGSEVICDNSYSTTEADGIEFGKLMDAFGESLNG